MVPYNEENDDQETPEQKKRRLEAEEEAEEEAEAEARRGNGEPTEKAQLLNVGELLEAIELTVQKAVEAFAGPIVEAINSHQEAIEDLKKSVDAQDATESVRDGIRPMIAFLEANFAAIEKAIQVKPIEKSVNPLVPEVQRTLVSEKLLEKGTRAIDGDKFDALLEKAEAKQFELQASIPAYQSIYNKRRAGIAVTAADVEALEKSLA